MKILRVLLVIFIVTAWTNVALANTPGKHSVLLKWVASTTTGVTYNVYRGSSAGVCSGTPTPYVTGVTQVQYLDLLGLSDGQTLFYNVSAVGAGGAESACDGEIQVLIPVLPVSPSGLSGAPQ